MAKPKVAFYWCASCGGCEEAVVDLAEKVLNVVAAVDIVFWPVALDFKKSDVEAMPDKSIAVSFINGAIRLSEQEEMAQLLRRKSQVVIAFGACAQLGGIPGLANLWDRRSIFDWYYRQAPSVAPDGSAPATKVKVPEGELELPAFWDTVKSLDQVIDVDYFVPGCPPTPKVLLAAVEALLGGKLPPKGAVLAGDKSLCHECRLNDSKPEKILIADLKRITELQLDPEKCYLAQGVICLGPVTRGGCEALCIEGHMPCTGCFGPLDQTPDYGGTAVSFLASIVDVNDEAEAKRVLDKVADPTGIVYRYSLARSKLGRKRLEAGA
ncbi:MAG TPA: oxidoreductase [Thermoplasmata archaeon]|nr:oxidoreductase [Thermoplasmata archaeon]